MVWIASGYRWHSVKTIEAYTLVHGTRPDRFADQPVERRV
jgi:hypothetical protein